MWGITGEHRLKTRENTAYQRLHRRGLKQSLARTGIHDFFVFFFLPPDFLSFTYKKLFCMKYKQALTVTHRHVHLKVWKIMQKIK